MALDSLSNVKAALLISGSDDDAVLERIMKSAEEFILEHTGRKFEDGTFTEDHAGGRRTLFLRNFPVASITSLKADGSRQFGSDTLVAADRYFVHVDRGVIVSLWGPFLPAGPGTIRVVYTTGIGLVPAVIKEAFSQLVAFWYRVAKTQAGMDFESLTELTDTGAGTTKAYPWNLSTGPRLPPGVMQLLQRYLVPMV